MRSARPRASQRRRLPRLLEFRFGCSHRGDVWWRGAPCNLSATPSHVGCWPAGSASADSLGSDVVPYWVHIQARTSSNRYQIETFGNQPLPHSTSAYTCRSRGQLCTLPQGRFNAIWTVRIDCFCVRTHGGICARAHGFQRPVQGMHLPSPAGFPVPVHNFFTRRHRHNRCGCAAAARPEPCGPAVAWDLAAGPDTPGSEPSGLG